MLSTAGSLATLPRGVWDGGNPLVPRPSASVPYSYSYPYEAAVRVVHSSHYLWGGWVVKILAGESGGKREVEGGGW